MFEDIIGSVYTTVPVMAICIVLIIAVAILFLRQQRQLIWYWRNSIPAPVVFNQEGERMKPVPNGDAFRKTIENKVVYLQSKRFGDKFPAEHLFQLIEYRKSGRGEKAEFLPLVRKGAGIWSALRFTKEGEEMRAGSDTDDILKARTALAIMREGNKQHLGEDFLTKYMPLISAFLMGVMLFLALVITIQYISAATGTHISAMNSNTDALIRLINQTANCTAPIIRPPA
jgi:hypothetical protein